MFFQKKQNQKIELSKWVIFVLIAVFSLTQTVIAATGVNKQINYQAKLSDNLGVSVPNGDYDMVFKIYTVPNGGTAVWTGNYTDSNANPVAVSKGVFSVLLGSGTNNELDIDFSEDEYYLGVTVGTDTEMTPRKRIGSVPQAINANNLIGDGLIRITGNPTGNNASQGTVYINPASASSGDSLLGVAVNGAQKFKIDEGGNVIQSGDLAINGGDITSNSSLTLTPNSGSNVNINLSGGGDFAVNTNQLYVDTSTGNVGIGVNSPSAFLHVIGTTEQLRLGYDASNYFSATIDATGGITFDAVGAGQGFTFSDGLIVSGDIRPGTNDTYDLGSNSLRFKDLYLGGDTLHIGTSATDEGLMSYDTTNNILNFGTDSTTNGDIAFNTNQLYIDKSTGYIGLGDVTPDHLLDVAGNIGLNASSYINFGDTDGTGGYGIRDNAGTLEYKNSGGSWATMGSGGSSSTFLSLTDTPSAFTANRIMYTNSGATALTDNSNFTYDGNNLAIGGSIKLAMDSNTCDAGKEGAMRYNSATKLVEFCNATIWAPFSSGGASLGYNNLRIKNNATTPNTQIDINAAYIEVGGYSKTTFSTTINAATVGVNGIDTGSLAASTWYYVWAIYNPTTGTMAGLLSTSSTAPTLPTNYTQKRLISMFKTDSSSYLIKQSQIDERVDYDARQQIASGLSSSTYATQDISSLIPIASGIAREALFGGTSPSGNAGTTMLSLDGVNAKVVFTTGEQLNIGDTTELYSATSPIFMPVSGNNIYYKRSNSYQMTFYVRAYTISLGNGGSGGSGGGSGTGGGETRKLLQVQDQKASGTSGGASIAGTQTRTLNTVVTNEIPGASLASNQITLPAGDYYIEGLAPSGNGAVFYEKARLYNVTSSSYILEGGNTLYYSPATINGKITLPQTSVLELRHYTNSAATDGLGYPNSQGTEVYSDLRIWQINGSTTGSSSSIWDMDGNTGIQAEKNFNEDYLRFSTGGTERMTLNPSGNLGVGTTSPSARIHALGTTEQLRLGYDTSNYVSETVGSTGGVTFDAVGTGAGFTFADNVSVSGSLKLANDSATCDSGKEGAMRYNSTSKSVEFCNGSAWGVFGTGSGGTGSGVTLGYQNLRIKNNATTPNTQIDISADYLEVQGYSSSSFSATINAATTGANGLDTGSLVANTWYYVWSIYNPNTSTMAGLLSTNSTAPTMPSGYTKKRLISMFKTDSSAYLIKQRQTDDRIDYDIKLQIASGLTSTSYASQDISGQVPTSTNLVKNASFGAISGTINNVYTSLSADGTNPILVISAYLASNGVEQYNHQFIPVNNNAIYYKIGSDSITLYARAYTISLGNGGGTGSLWSQSGSNISYSSGNVGIGSSDFGTSANNVLSISGSTAPTTSITDGIQLFAVDVAGFHELRVRDEAGNVTTLSPHNFSTIPGGASENLAWSYYSERDNKSINVDMTKVVRLIEGLTGEKLIYTTDLITNLPIDMETLMQPIQLKEDVASLLTSVTELNLKTNSNVSDITELQDSIDTQLGVIEKTLGHQSSAVSDLDNAVQTLQSQIIELQNQANQELNIAQIDQNTADISYLKTLLGINLERPNEISITGKFKAENIETGLLTVKIVDEENATIGTAIICPPGKALDSDSSCTAEDLDNDGKKVVVKTGVVKSDSKLFITIKKADEVLAAKIGKITAGESFEIEIDKSSDSPIEIDWWVVDTK